MMVQTPVRKRISRFLGRETVAEARTEHIVLGEKVGSLVLRFAARLGAIEGGIAWAVPLLITVPGSR
jgi:hypothetical protein